MVNQSDHPWRKYRVNFGVKEQDRWKSGAKERFFEGLRQYGPDWKKVCQVVRTKSSWNCQLFFANVSRRVIIGKPHPHADLIRKHSKVNGYWTRKEHEQFREALKKYGRDNEKVAAEIPTKGVH